MINPKYVKSQNPGMGICKNCSYRKNNYCKFNHDIIRKYMVACDNWKAKTGFDYEEEANV